MRINLDQIKIDLKSNLTCNIEPFMTPLNLRIQFVFLICFNFCPKDIFIDADYDLNMMYMIQRT